MPRLLAAVLTLLPATPAMPAVSASQADLPAIEGTWLNESGEAQIRIAPCKDDEDEMCGHIVWLREPLNESGEPRRDVNNPQPELRERPMIGLQVIRDASGPDHDGVWSGATVYDPARGKSYRCKLEPHGIDRLRVRGFVGIPWFGRTLFWTRVP